MAFKFNNGFGAIVCDHEGCNAIIAEGLDATKYREEKAKSDSQFDYCKEHSPVISAIGYIKQLQLKSEKLVDSIKRDQEDRHNCKKFLLTLLNILDKRNKYKGNFTALEHLTYEVSGDPATASYKESQVLLQDLRRLNDDVTKYMDDYYESIGNKASES